MLYCSTRNPALSVSDIQAVLSGLAPDGGLYVPLQMPRADWKKIVVLSWSGIAEEIVSAMLPGFEDIPGLVRRAYEGKFETKETTPIVPVGNQFVLELFRGPTCAFKDVALSLLPQLLTAAKKQIGDSSTTLILTATSGDTGKAALAGFANVPGVKIAVFYPEDGVSDMQKLQMQTQTGSNVTVCAVKGNFDDAQSGVKSIFSACTDGILPGCDNVHLSSANSINIGRLVPQMVYYFYAYGELVRRKVIRLGDSVDYTVPTGNFGDILAGYLAKRLGLPVGKLICASNANNVLTDFLTTGVYNRNRAFHKTYSPSMDILISSNLERMLYFVTDGDAISVSAWMKALKDSGSFTVPGNVLAKLREILYPACCDDERTLQIIHRVWLNDHYVCDPHTAVGMAAARQYAAEYPSSSPMVVLSTASPYKFPVPVLKAVNSETVEDAFAAAKKLQAFTGVPVPAPLAGLASRPVLHRDVISPADMMEYVKVFGGAEKE